MNKFTSTLHPILTLNANCFERELIPNRRKKTQRLEHRKSVKSLNIGNRIFNAGKSFLNSIHQEIYDALPQWKKDAIAKDLNEEQEMLAEQIIVRPELTEDYINAISDNTLPTNVNPGTTQRTTIENN